MKLVTRAQWRARPWRTPNGAIPYAGKPRGVKVHYLGTYYAPRAHPLCPAYVRQIQNQHMDGRGWSDIGYSFLVCTHGYVYEGRGLKRRSSANGSISLNEQHYAVCALLGSAGVMKPTDAQLHGIRDAIEYCRAKGPADGEIKGHRDGYATACPGEPLYAWVRKGAPRPEDDMTPEQAKQLRELHAALVQRSIPTRVRTAPQPPPSYSIGQHVASTNERAWAALDRLRAQDAVLAKLAAAGAARDAVLAQLVEALAARDGAVDVDALLERISERITQGAEQLAAELARIEVEVRVADEAED